MQAPAGAGEIHAVLDQVAAGTLDDAGSDGPALGERGGVVEVVGLVGQVGGGLVGVGPPSRGRAPVQPVGSGEGNVGPVPGIGARSWFWPGACSFMRIWGSVVDAPDRSGAVGRRSTLRP